MPSRLFEIALPEHRVEGCDVVGGIHELLQVGEVSISFVLRFLLASRHLPIVPVLKVLLDR